MRVIPVTEAEAAAAGLWKKGMYDFEIVNALEKQSKAGNEMIEAQVKIYDKEGKSRTVFDFLVSSEGMSYKVRHAAAACGLLEQYEAGALHAIDMIGKAGRCHLGIDKGKDGYPPKNVIADYVVESGKLIDSVSDADLNDEIPF